MAKSVLVVDGDECTRELLALHLSNAGYRVIAAEDAVLAVHRVLREPPDLIIADVNMKYLDGLEFLAALRDDGRTRHVPVIFLTKPVFADRLLGAVAQQLS
jgi:two-component system chemotaxis response regulator CheY